MLALEGPERGDEGMRGRLPAVAVGAEGGLVRVAGTRDPLEVVPGGAFPFERLVDGVFTLFADWMHLVEADRPERRNLRLRR